MKKSVQRQSLPVTPSLEYLRKQAKKRARENPALKLAAAQHQIAKEYGFTNWAELARGVEALARGTGSKADLAAAILSENSSEVARLLEGSPTLLDVDLWPVAMLQAASPAMTRLLLARGLNPNESSSPRKPLHFAVDKGWPDIVEELLQHGADPNIRDGEGFTPLDLYGGLTDGRPEVARPIVEILRKAGAEVNVWTSIRIGDTERALVLLRATPALMNEKSPDLGFLPLHVAARMANGPIVRWLLDHGADVNGTNPTENAALWFVCQSGEESGARLEVARMLISAGADVNRRCEKGSTALGYAAWRGPAAMVELLLSHGARNWIVDDEGKLPIDYARRSNVSPDKDDIVKLFSGPRIENPIFGEAVDAIATGNLQTLKRLLRENPDLVQTRAEEKGEYAGYYFFKPFLLEFVPENPIRTRKLPSNICEIAQTIIAAGAPQEAIDKTLALAASGNVPRECGVQRELLELLVSKGADPTKGLNAAINEGEWSAAETLLRLGARLGLTAAAGLGRTDRLEEFLARSSHMEELVQAANAAIRGGHIRCVKLLLDAGLPITMPVPNHPYSPTLLHQAAWSGNRAIVQLLLKRGANPTAIDTQFKGTPADWAHHAGHKELSEWLRSGRERMAQE